MTTRILHLSDLHFGAEHYFNESGNNRTSFTLGEAIADALARAGITSLDAVVVTGDLFSMDQPKDQAFAMDQIPELIQRLQIDAGKVYFVPGNRDLSWDEAFAKRPFRFYDELLASISPTSIKRDQLPNAVRVTSERGPDVDLILLDSCHLESREMEGYGMVGDPQIKTLRELRLLSQPPSRATVRIAALHHHLLPVWGMTEIYDKEARRPKPLHPVSLTLDALSVLRQLAMRDVSVVLHGHQHKPSIVRYENHLANPYSMAIVGAGSAGARGAERRQFFLHEVEPDTLHSRSFVQSADNPSMFEPDTDTSAVVPLVPPARDHACVVDRRVTRLRRAAQLLPEQPGEGKRSDSSDLFYLFLSVVKCAEARQIIRHIEETWRREEGKEKEDEVSSLGITEMYDLMGKWDLLVRFRMARSELARKFANKILTRLQGGHDHQEDYDRKHFASREFIDVWDEKADLGSDRSSDHFPLFRTRLGNTQEYESRRCQRAFIVIQCGKDDAKEEIVRDLRIHRRLKEFEGPDGIIESCSIAQHDIVLDIFLTCSQMVLLNKLNREIEECLAPYRVQKYTLLCYGYDEQLAAGVPMYQEHASLSFSPDLLPLGKRLKVE